MNIFRVFSSVFAIVVFSSCTSPTYKVCTEIGCSNGYTLALNHSSWAAGDYQIDIEIDGTKYTCATTLPFTSCNLPAPCNSDKVSIGLSGCALPASDQSISDVRTTLVDFSQLKLKISRGTEVLLEKSLTPVFKTSQPNGPGCEPTCRNANDSIQF